METKRITVTLEGAEQAALSVFADPQRAEHAALEAWAAEHGLTVRSSEAGVVRALLRAGAEALREKALEQGYAHLAEAQRADEDRQAERSTKRARQAQRDRRMSA
ncbi:hypothetical protein JOF41_005229 [Saccharothrix coeruleofusca]|uniref:hypothetical protein n=1 Tax=Saccharothrix coeruleofusca TaxID=33919 RepID=UPI001AE81EB4|nr:hypothetical protein [Saccharothrix coeruleofusca]MBP2339051.1 hypothetical protein [Saccharothrix coeruleofusca]